MVAELLNTHQRLVAMGRAVEVVVTVLKAAVMATVGCSDGGRSIVGGDGGSSIRLWEWW